MMRRNFHILSFVAAACASSFSQPPSVSLHLPDWGLKSVSSIILGQCAMVHLSDGDQLQVQALFDKTVFQSSAPDSSAGMLPVSAMNSQSINSLGGSSSTFAGNGAAASAIHIVSKDRVEAVAVTYYKGGKGYCGLWMHLFNSMAPRDLRRYVDATGYTHLLVAIRGVKGNERVQLKVADRIWNEKEDAVAVGPLERYVPAGKITTSWQIARVPLQYLPKGLDRKNLATLVFEALSPSNGTFEIGPIAFSRDPAARLLPAKQRSPSPRQHGRALWVWDTDNILHDNGTDTLLTFIRTRKISTVYLGLPYDASRSRAAGGIVLDKMRLEPIVRSLRSVGATVEALVGDKAFILPGQRNFVTNTVEHVVEYNASVTPEARFTGIHFDVEPYLLPGFTSPNQRWFTDNFLAMLKAFVPIARKGHLSVGADIPPWYDSANELANRFIPSSGDRPFYEQIIDLLDTVTLMDYRTDAQGDNGIAMLAVRELAYAERTGKKVFVGLETTPLPAETILTFREPLTKGIPQRVPVLLVMEKGEGSEWTYFQEQKELERWLQKKVGRSGMYYWPVLRSTRVASSRTTFASFGMTHLEETMRRVEATFIKYDSFAGFAIHSYRSYMKMGR